MRIVLAVIVFVAVQFGMPASAATGPSFPCEGDLKAAERTICADPELAAYDRAMAWAWRHHWKSSATEWTSQRGWRAKRDACGTRKPCILASYREWIDGLPLAPVPDQAPSFERTTKPDNGGADLLLAKVRLFGKPISPIGKITVLNDRGTLIIQDLGGEWFLFQVDAVHAYDPHDGLGANATTSGAAGVVHLLRGKGTWHDQPEMRDGCTVRFDRLDGHTWHIEESGIGCSGLGSTLSGTYRRRR